MNLKMIQVLFWNSRNKLQNSF